MKSDTKTFINKASSIHKNRYDYDKVVYVKAREKVIIRCRIHGAFLQKPQHHLRGSGCPKCSKNIHQSKKEFVQTLKNRCGCKLSYTVIGEYLGTNYNVLTKDEFGVCYSQASHLLKCRRPGIRTAIDKNSYWVNRAKKLYNDKYDYTKVNFINNLTKVDIICKEHGVFSQIPNSHMSGAGCPDCANIAISNHQKEFASGWSHTVWGLSAKKSKNFDSFKVYIIRCWDENESFYKIGKTFRKVEQRFRVYREMPYFFEILKIIEDKNPKVICELEANLKFCNKVFNYTPVKEFGGMYECFSYLNSECL